MRHSRRERRSVSVSKTEIATLCGPREGERREREHEGRREREGERAKMKKEGPNCLFRTVYVTSRSVHAIMCQQSRSLTAAGHMQPWSRCS